MIRSLLHYNLVSNKLFIDLIIENKVSDKECLRLMSHIINAQHIWNARLEGKVSKLTAWIIHETNNLNLTNERVYEQSIKLMSLLAPNLVVKYQNSTGNQFSNSVQNVMLHITNHATYHRGQLAIKLKELGITPPSSDFIHYQKENL